MSRFRLPFYWPVVKSLPAPSVHHPLQIWHIRHLWSSFHPYKVRGHLLVDVCFKQHIIAFKNEEYEECREDNPYDDDDEFS